MSNKASTKTNQVVQNKEHIRISWPAQDVSCGQRSDQQEVPSPEKSNPREAADSVNIRINQEVAVESAAKAETKQNSGIALL